jgi:hypothetical protein
MHVKENTFFIKNKNVKDKYNSSSTNHAMHIAVGMGMVWFWRKIELN